MPSPRNIFPASPLGKHLRAGQDLNRGLDDPLFLGDDYRVSPAVYQQSGRTMTQRQLRISSIRQDPPLAFTIVARSRLPQDTVIASIRNELREYRLRSAVDTSEVSMRFSPADMAHISCLEPSGHICHHCTLISAVGIYAVTRMASPAYQEIGVRMAPEPVSATSVVSIKAGLVRSRSVAACLTRRLDEPSPGKSSCQHHADRSVTFVLISLVLATGRCSRALSLPGEPCV